MYEYARFSVRKIQLHYSEPMYGCETWSLILKEERKLIAFKDRVLRRIFGGKRDGVNR
jgi:hypothetical protein